MAIKVKSKTKPKPSSRSISKLQVLDQKTRNRVLDALAYFNMFEDDKYELFEKEYTFTELKKALAGEIPKHLSSPQQIILSPPSTQKIQ